MINLFNSPSRKNIGHAPQNYINIHPHWVDGLFIFNLSEGENYIHWIVYASCNVWEPSNHIAIYWISLIITTLAISHVILHLFNKIQAKGNVRVPWTTIRLNIIHIQMNFKYTCLRQSDRGFVACCVKLTHWCMIFNIRDFYP